MAESGNMDSLSYMAAALRDMGGGRLIGTDLEPGKIERAGANVVAAGLSNRVEFRVGMRGKPSGKVSAATSI